MQCSTGKNFILDSKVTLSTLFIIINDKRFRSFIKERNKDLYMKIYSDEKELYTKEDIKGIILKINAKTFNDIIFYQDLLSTEYIKDPKNRKAYKDRYHRELKPGHIGSFYELYKMMELCINARKQQDLEEPTEQEESTWKK